MIYEIYPTIQGEGLEAGKSVILIRFSGCNLRCVFGNSLCDTVESSFLPVKEYLDLDHVVKVLKIYPNIKNVLITGGEPTLYPDLLSRLIHRIHNLGENHRISLETNGTKFFWNNHINFISISPKLSSQLPLADVEYKVGDRIFKFPKAQVDYLNTLRYNEKVLREWIERYPKRYQLKFVIFNEQDIEEAMSIVNKIQADRTQVWFMPAGDTLEKVNELRTWLIDWTIKLGVNYSDRLQLFFNDKYLKNKGYVRQE